MRSSGGATASGARPAEPVAVPACDPSGGIRCGRSPRASGRRRPGPSPCACAATPRAASPARVPGRFAVAGEARAETNEPPALHSLPHPQVRHGRHPHPRNRATAKGKTTTQLALVLGCHQPNWKPHFHCEQRAGHAGPLRAGARRGRGDEADAARACAARRRAREGARGPAARGCRPAGQAAPAPPLPRRPGRTARMSSRRKSRRRRSASAKRCRSWPSPRQSGSGSTSGSRRFGRSNASWQGCAFNSRRSGRGRPVHLPPSPSPLAIPARERAAASDSAAATAVRAGSRPGRGHEAPAQQHARRPAAEKTALNAPAALVSSAVCSSRARARGPAVGGPLSPCPRM